MRYRELYTGKAVKATWFEYFLAFMFAMLGGFESVGLIPFKTYILSLLCIVFISNNRKKWNVGTWLPLALMVAAFEVIGYIHMKTFDFVSKRTLLELPLLTMSGFYIVMRLGNKFRYLLLYVMTILSGISLFFFFVMLFTGYIPRTPLSTDMYPGNVFFYVIRAGEIIRERNCGPYWEPGAFGGYILMTLMLFFNSFGELWKRYRRCVVILLLALLTTKSTQAYVCGMILVLLYFYKERLTLKTFLYGMMAVAVIAVAFTRLPFMKEKINEHLELASDWENEQSILSANRFTTTLVDVYAIMSSPLYGNTDEPEIRYSQNSQILWIIEHMGGYGSGSGITCFIASYGIPMFCLWLLLTYKRLRYVYGGKSALCLLFVIAALGQCEQYSNAIFYLSFPFLSFQDKTIRT